MFSIYVLMRSTNAKPEMGGVQNTPRVHGLPAYGMVRSNTQSQPRSTELFFRSRSIFPRIVCAMREAD